MAHVFDPVSIGKHRQLFTRVKYFVGVDLGKAQDFTAICVLEQLDVPDIEPDRHYSAIPYHPTQWNIRHLQRLPLQTSYVDIARQVFAMMHTSPLQKAELIVDETGVGAPVVDIFREAGLEPVAVVITAGDGAHQDIDARRKGHERWKVSKLMLVSSLQAELHNGTLKVAEELPETAAFTTELHNFRINYTDAGNARFEAREGMHDDLVLAAAIAMWRAKLPEPTARVRYA